MAFNELRLWLKATPEAWSGGPGGDGGPEGDGIVWLDASVHHNHASMSEAALPELVSDAANGYSVVRFGPELTTLTVADDASIQFGVDPFVIVLVARWRNSNRPASPYFGSAYILTKLEAEYPSPGLLFFANYPQIYLDRPAMTRFAVQLEQGSAFALTGESGLNDNHLRVLTVRRSSRTELQLRVNGKIDARAVLPQSLSVSSPSFPLIIGGVTNAAFDGDLAEVVAIAEAVEDDRLSGLERFLLDKYGLSEP